MDPVSDPGDDIRRICDPNVEGGSNGHRDGCVDVPAAILYSHLARSISETISEDVGRTRIVKVKEVGLLSQVHDYFSLES